MIRPLDIRRFLQDRNGASAVEFAIIAPVVVILMIGLVDAANIISTRSAAQRATRVGVQYLMNGGTSSSTAQTLATQNWTNKPSGGTVSVSQVCKCGSTVTDCTSTCTGGVTMRKTWTVLSTATVTGSVIPSTTVSASESVRIQ